MELGDQRQIGLLADAGLGALSPYPGLKSGHWTENEFGAAPLGNAWLGKGLGKNKGKG